MNEDKFLKSMQKTKVKKQLKNAAERYNSTIFSKLQRKMNLTTEQEEEIVHLLSNNDQFIKQWIKHNEK